MTCYRPNQAYRSNEINPKTGNRRIIFQSLASKKFIRDRFDVEGFKLPCGHCIGCRIDYSRQWAIRCVHEAQMHERNCFITLTYAEKFVPKDFSLDKRVFKRFVKRLRKKFGSGIRYFGCGEYGDLNRRPHYHICVFGHDFDDKYLFKVVNGIKLFRSPSLEKLWKYGYSSVGDVTFQSAAYVARYCTKKITGHRALYHYQRDIDLETGEVLSIVPEFALMSTDGGIGKSWFLQYGSDVYPSDEVVLRGRKMRPPRYYDRLYERFDPAGFMDIKRKRKAKALIHSEDQTQDRLYVREMVQMFKAEKLIRQLDLES